MLKLMHLPKAIFVENLKIKWRTGAKGKVMCGAIKLVSVFAT